MLFTELPLGACSSTPEQPSEWTLKIDAVTAIRV